MRRESERTFFTIAAGTRLPFGSETITLAGDVEVCIEKGLDEQAISEIIVASGNAPAVTAGRVPVPCDEVKAVEEPVEAPKKTKGRPKKAK